MMYGRGVDWGSGMMGGAGWVGVLLMTLFGLLVIAGIVLLIVWAMRSSAGGHASMGAGPRAPMPGHDEAVATARKRLASGEITKEQYDQIMSALGG